MPDMRDADESNVWTLVADDEGVTTELGRALGAAAEPGDVFALSGGLGAGKTALTQGIARGLGVPSPTFNLLLVHPGRLALYHFDLYRLQRPEELDDIDFWGTLEADGVSVIEWADQFPGTMPDERLDVLLETTGPTARRITLVPRGARHRALCEALASRAGVGP
jgi:tRNA threonylcarbamoyladenosine biosynthesis protein TsaE